MRFYHAHTGRLLFMPLDDHQLLLVQMNILDVLCVLHACLFYFFIFRFVKMHFFSLSLYVVVWASDNFFGFVRVELVSFVLYIYIEHVWRQWTWIACTINYHLKNLFSDICPIKSSLDNAITRCIVFFFSQLYMRIRARADFWSEASQIDACCVVKWKLNGVCRKIKKLYKFCFPIV